jgi:glycosyltransferase involved in cell wall biosynthesis
MLCVKIAYVTHTRFPTEKAHGHQIARVAEAMVKLGHDVTLASPDILNKITHDHVQYYHLEKDFTAKKIETFDAFQSKIIPGRFAFLFTMSGYRRSLKKYFADNKFDLLYARSPQVLPALLSTKMPVVLELHTLPKRGKSKFTALCKKCKRVVCLTSPMRDELVSWGVPKNKIIVEGDAVDLERFEKLPTINKAKHHFGVPDDRFIIGYIGSLVTMDKVQKGVEILIKAMPSLKQHYPNVFLFVVGGPDLWIERYRKLALHSGLTDHDFLFHGPVRPKLVPDAMTACDVCVYPSPVPKHQYFKRDTSPLKLFEYLAAGKPVICADIPPVRDVADKTIVRFVQPGSVSSLAGGLRDVIDHPAEAKQRSTKGLTMIKNHSWKKRMKRVLDSL